jgi:8-oxo-dGTP diphosphatase
MYGKSKKIKFRLLVRWPSIFSLLQLSGFIFHQLTNFKTMNPVSVTCAIIYHKDKILAVKRPKHKHQGGKWEFPGGKIEPDETPADCIVREIMEELSVEIEITRQLTEIRHCYPDKEIVLIPFLCEIKSGEIILKEHEDAVWIKKDEITNLDWAAADLKVIEVNITNN